MWGGCFWIEGVECWGKLGFWRGREEEEGWWSPPVCLNTKQRCRSRVFQPHHCSDYVSVCPVWAELHLLTTLLLTRKQDSCGCLKTGQIPGTCVCVCARLFVCLRMFCVSISESLNFQMTDRKTPCPDNNIILIPQSQWPKTFKPIQPGHVEEGLQWKWNTCVSHGLILSKTQHNQP